MNEELPADNEAWRLKVRSLQDSVRTLGEAKPAAAKSSKKKPEKPIEQPKAKKAPRLSFLPSRR